MTEAMWLALFDLLKNVGVALVPTFAVVFAWWSQRKAAKEAALTLDVVAGRVDGHLSKITAALAHESKLNTVLTVENDRMAEGTTTIPVAQTPEHDAQLTRDPVDGTVTLHERARRPRSLRRKRP